MFPYIPAPVTKLWVASGSKLVVVLLTPVLVARLASVPVRVQLAGLSVFKVEPEPPEMRAQSASVLVLMAMYWLALA